MAVTNQLMFNSLTKMVIFTPFFLIINEAPFDIQYQELHRSGDPWQTVIYSFAIEYYYYISIWRYYFATYFLRLSNKSLSHLYILYFSLNSSCFVCRCYKTRAHPCGLWSSGKKSCCCYVCSVRPCMRRPSYILNNIRSAWNLITRSVDTIRISN